MPLPDVLVPGSVRPVGRDGVTVILDQLAAVDAWHAERRAEQAATSTTGVTREMRLDLSRRHEALRREQEALRRRAAEQLAASVALLPARAPVRAVVAHRSEWLREGVATALAAHGVQVVGSFGDGADAAGTLVCEQPDLLLVEDRLPTLSGLEVVARARRFSPATVVGVQVEGAAGAAELTSAGAAAVFSRRTPPKEVAAQLVAALSGGGVTVGPS